MCTGRFYDFLEKRQGRWGIVLRQQDRLDPVNPGTPLQLEPERLSAFPVGYRHLAYVQSVLGFDVKRDMPGLTGWATSASICAGPTPTWWS